jgi:hypothetical protein
MGGFGIRFSTDSDVTTSPRNKISDRAASYREDGTDPLDRKLRNFLKNRKLIRSLEYCSSANEADARRIGDIDWSVSEKNKKFVSDAMKQVRAKDIGNLDWRHWYHNATVLQGNVWFLDSSQLHCNAKSESFAQGRRRPCGRKVWRVT